MRAEQFEFLIVSLIGIPIFIIWMLILHEPVLSLAITIAICMAIFTGLNVHIDYTGGK